MKKNILFVFLFVSGSFCTFGQETNSPKLIRTESNGVQVYEGAGNEMVGNETLSERSPTSTPIRTLNDWSLVECENALYYIGLKIEQMKENEGNELQIQEYEAQKVLIFERMNFLSSNN